MMGLYVDVIRSKFSTKKDYFKIPGMGFYLDFAGQCFCVTVDREGVFLSLKPISGDASESTSHCPKKSLRLKGLPRFSCEFDYLGKRLIVKGAPLLETVLNRFVNQTQFLNALKCQFKETPSPSKFKSVNKQTPFKRRAELQSH